MPSALLQHKCDVPVYSAILELLRAYQRGFNMLTARNMLTRLKLDLLGLGEHVFIHSFIDLYSSSLRKLVRGAPHSSTVKKNHFQFDYRICPKVS